MRKLLLFAGLILFTACSTKTEQREEKKASSDPAFENFKQNFILSLWKMYPGWASGAGYHLYDHVLFVPDSAQRLAETRFAETYLDSLKNYESSKLSSLNKIDHYLIRDFLYGSLFSLNKLKAYQWDPSGYNICGGFAEMLNNNYDSLDKRLVNFHAKMLQVAPYYEAAKRNIKDPTIEHTELAISQNEGGASVFETDLADALAKSHLSAQIKEEIKVRGKECAKTVRDFAGWLKKYKNPNPRSFRLGKELYHAKFEHEIQSGYTAEQIYEKAMAHKKELHAKMFDLTTQLWNRYQKKKMPEDTLLAIREMIDVLSTKHVSPDSFQIAIEKQIPVLVDFINKKDLIYLDPTKPLVVRKEPAYMAGMAGASISSPGPYDINGNTYYNVGSMTGWTKERSESYLREYNHYILQILNIHEAIPGHYTQLIYSNQSAAGDKKDSSRKEGQLPGIVKSIFGNGAMVEGWAVYSELMMLENGYGSSTGSSQADPEMWLMYYKWNLRSTCNTILDYGIHVNNMTREQVIHLLTKEAFQQQAEAEGKWRRATLSQVQLCSYFTGFTEICALREEIKNKMKDKFDLKSFHEKFLSYGSAPVKYIRELMLEDHPENHN